MHCTVITEVEVAAQHLTGRERLVAVMARNQVALLCALLGSPRGVVVARVINRIGH